jgi:hypothetical protein
MSLAFFAAPFDELDQSNANTNTNNYLQKKRVQKTKEPFNNININTHSTEKKKKEAFDSEKVNRILKHLHESSADEEEEDNYGPSPPKPEEPAATAEKESFSTYFNDPPPLPHSIGADKKGNDAPMPVSMPNLDDLNSYKQNYHDEQDAETYYKRTLPQYAALKRQNYYTKNNNNNNNNNPNDVLLQKINYMIHLLEEQQDEKTNNVTEEVVLFSFLGIFMIFLADSFVRIGKYVR